MKKIKLIFIESITFIFLMNIFIKIIYYIVNLTNLDYRTMDLLMLFLIIVFIIPCTCVITGYLFNDIQAN